MYTIPPIIRILRDEAPFKELQREMDAYQTFLLAYHGAFSFKLGIYELGLNVNLGNPTNSFRLNQHDYDPVHCRIPHFRLDTIKNYEGFYARQLDVYWNTKEHDIRFSEITRYENLPVGVSLRNFFLHPDLTMEFDSVEISYQVDSFFQPITTTNVDPFGDPFWLDPQDELEFLAQCR